MHVTILVQSVNLGTRKHWYMGYRSAAIADIFAMT
jgi:hypothetical protein